MDIIVWVAPAGVISRPGMSAVLFNREPNHQHIDPTRLPSKHAKKIVCSNDALILVRHSGFLLSRYAQGTRRLPVQ